MKTLKEYIAESVEFEPHPKFKDSYLVTLLRHENLDLSTIEEDEFVKLMHEDIKKAINEYVELMKPVIKTDKEDYLNKERERNLKYAKSKWKTEKKWNQYLETAMKNSEEWFDRGFCNHPERISFDMETVPNTNSIRGICVWGKDTSKNTIKQAFNEELEDNKWFRKGIGWAFKYIANSKEKPYETQRPYIQILFNESDDAEWKRDAENFGKAIEDFYKDSNYWGD